MASVTAQGSTMTARFFGTLTETFTVVTDAASRMFDASVATAPNKHGHFFGVWCICFFFEWKNEQGGSSTIEEQLSFIMVESTAAKTLG